MWPVAPKMSHIFCAGGLVSEGGSVEAGRRSFESLARVVLGERTSELPAAVDMVGDEMARYMTCSAFTVE